jgi:hypothetical protein
MPGHSKVAAAAAVAEAWNLAHLEYAVAHGVEDFPQGVGRDLDVLVKPGQGRRAVGLARAALEAHGYQVLLPPSLWGHRLLALRGEDWSDLLEIHTLEGIGWHHTVFAAQPNPTGRIGPFAVDPWASFAKQILLPLLANGLQRFTQQPERLVVTEAQQAAAARRLPEFIGPPAAAAFLDALASRDLDRLSARLPAMRRDLFRAAWKRTPLRATRAALQAAYRQFARYFYPCAPVIALVGPDGAGKSSVLAELAGGEKGVFTDIVVRHWRPGLLPPLSALSGKAAAEPPPGAGVPPRRHPGRLKWVRAAYYFLDFVLGYYARDRVLSARQVLVLYDRCGLDMAVDPARYGLASARGLRLFWRLIPKPDLVVLLADTPERVHQRKPELELPAIERQLELWQQFVQSGAVQAAIQVDAPPAEIARRLRALILRALVRKLS